MKGVLLILIFLIGCSPIKRHARLVKKFPHVHTQDTIKFIDTIRIEVPKISVDTLFKIDSFLVKLRDTILIEKEKLKIKMYTVHDSVFIEGSCDTIFIEKIIENKVPIRYYETINKSEWKKQAGTILISFLIIILLIILYRVIKFLL